MVQNGATIVEAKDVHRVYKVGSVETKALRGVNLTIKKGEFAAICGPSGSGKTTLLNLIGALDTPDSGDILVEGNSLKSLSATQRSVLRRDRIGFVFQAYNLIPVLTAYENAEFVMLLQGRPPEERRKAVEELLERVGLKDLGHRFPNELSGGQQQRVAIARALAAKPAVILADEPTANVDSATAHNLIELMEHLNREHGVTFIFSTHDTKVMDSAHRLITLTDGQIESEEVRETQD